jgi:hypothetical protein
MTFDYAASAELFMPKRKPGARQAVSYRRFTTAAEAIRFAVEEFPSIRSLGAWMRVGDDHFSSDDIQRLYESDCYPRRRRKRKSS